MAEKTPLELAAAEQLAESYGLRLARLSVVQGGSVNSNFRLETSGGDAFFLRIYEEQDLEGAGRELELVLALTRAGVPTPAPLRTPRGTLLEQHAGKPVAVFPWIDGTMLCQPAVLPDHARKVGAALARVHASGATSDSDGRFTPRDLEARLAFVIDNAPAFAEIARMVKSRLTELVARRDPSLPRGVIHGDLFRDNVLWQSEEIVALIDFESASSGNFVFDLAVTLLSWCYADRFDPELLLALTRGYESVRPLGERERAALSSEAAIAALRFVTTRLTDYSLRAPPGKPPLRDFRRFLARLSEIDAGAFTVLHT